jgi:hypothetical protein
LKIVIQKNNHFPSDNRVTNERRKRSESPQNQVSCWKPRKNRSSNFDIMPPEGMELPPIGVNTPVNGVPNSFLSYANNPIACQYVTDQGSSGKDVNSSSGSKVLFS